MPYVDSYLVCDSDYPGHGTLEQAMQNPLTEEVQVLTTYKLVVDWVNTSSYRFHRIHTALLRALLLRLRTAYHRDYKASNGMVYIAAHCLVGTS